jgi:hypothetical protein
MPPIRTRDLRVHIKDWGFERAVVHTLEALLEERVQEREHFRELTELVAQCVDQVSKMIHVGDAMKRDIERINRIHLHGDQDDRQC